MLVIYHYELHALNTSPLCNVKKKIVNKCLVLMFGFQDIAYHYGKIRGLERYRLDSNIQYGVP